MATSVPFDPRVLKAPHPVPGAPDNWKRCFSFNTDHLELSFGGREPISGSLIPGLGLDLPGDALAGFGQRPVGELRHVPTSLSTSQRTPRPAPGPTIPR